MKAGEKKAASFSEEPFRYIVEKANPVFLICCAVFIVSFIAVLNLPLEDPPQSLFLYIIVRFFDAIGTIALFIAYLSAGVYDYDQTR